MTPLHSNSHCFLGLLMNREDRRFDTVSPPFEKPECYLPDGVFNWAFRRSKVNHFNDISFSKPQASLPNVSMTRLLSC